MFVELRDSFMHGIHDHESRSACLGGIHDSLLRVGNQNGARALSLQ